MSRLHLTRLLAVLSLVVGFKALAEDSAASAIDAGLSQEQSMMNEMINENALTQGAEGSDTQRPGGGFNPAPVHGGGYNPAPVHGGGYNPAPVHGGGFNPAPVHGGGYNPAPVHGGGYNPAPVHGGGYNPAPVHGGGYNPGHGEGPRPVHGIPGHGGYGEPGFHGGGPRPGWHEGWAWDYNRYPGWWHVGFAFPLFVWAVEAPYGYWQCESFDQYGDPFFASSPNLQQAQYNALYDCGGETFIGQCYIPPGYCQIR